MTTTNQQDDICYFHSNEPLKDQQLITSSLVLNNSNYNEALETFPITIPLPTTNNENTTTLNTIPIINNQKKRKISSSFKYYTSPNTEKKKKISISSTSITTSSCHCSNNVYCKLSCNCIVNSNPKHLKRREYQKRKTYSNSAQAQMEFNFPIWTFHLE
ncbi:predicted protein [Naegleria gruberi]|uniref:Predicted protein n=1 Tax=Naegleria gruberi TaxID=5762 RepID=D2VY77_NAEGR|nr:uncharacterized protein NAEGRDRAFT_74018 [Naegleria gruberi]EFC38153.1 predicted protein [Naegleria gruberi]|eukprot:XP_002670897.1 predicted protein [Naegleria gruberi strain NEG-M]